jgi:cytochrome P450
MEMVRLEWHGESDPVRLVRPVSLSIRYPPPLPAMWRMVRNGLPGSGVTSVTDNRAAAGDDQHMSMIPPGPRWPAAAQTLAWWSRPLPFFERCRARYGHRFTIRVLSTPPFVHITDPDEIKQVFTAPPDVLHPGEGARILEPVVGRHSVILLDENPHMEQRKLLLPAFHGERMQRLTGLITDVTEREVASWPRNTPAMLHERLQELTLEIILRAVFGLDPGPRLDALRTLLREMIEMGASPLSLVPALQRDLGPGSPGRRFHTVRDAIDRHVRELVEERRAESADRDDILAMLLTASHEDGSPMSFEEIRDELMTALVAGHETTASQLAWTFTLLARAPGAQRELARELDAGDGDAYLLATIYEAMRRRPVLPNAEPRLTMQEVRIGDWTYPKGVVLGVNAYLVHHDPAIYPDPYAFRPERFLDQAPGTYTWLPFGGGRRRCLGASFALLEMKVVLRAVLGDHLVRAVPGAGVEVVRRRSITLSPKGGARVVLTAREREGAAAPAASTGAV